MEFCQFDEIRHVSNLLLLEYLFVDLCNITLLTNIREVSFAS